MPVASPLNASPTPAIPGNEPRGSVAFHNPMTGIALAVVAKPCSSSAVTSSVSERPPLTLSEDQAEWPYPQSNPDHHPAAATTAGEASVPSAVVLQVPAASVVEKLTK